LASGQSAQLLLARHNRVQPIPTKLNLGELLDSDQVLTELLDSVNKKDKLSRSFPEHVWCPWIIAIGTAREREVPTSEVRTVKPEK